MYRDHIKQMSKVTNKNLKQYPSEPKFLTLNGAAGRAHHFSLIGCQRKNMHIHESLQSYITEFKQITPSTISFSFLFSEN